jgi:hypothetical protein
MEQEVNGLVLMCPGEMSAYRQGGSLRLLSVAAPDLLFTRSVSVENSPHE